MQKKESAFKSQTFRTQSLDQDEIKSDLESLSALTAKQLRAISKCLQDGDNLQLTLSRLSSVLKSLSDKHGIVPAQFETFRSIAMFLSRSCERGDSPKDVIDDIRRAKLFPTKQEKKLESVLGELTRLSPTIERAYTDLKRAAHVRSMIPAAGGMNYTVDIRVMFDKEFTPFKDSLSSYTQKPPRVQELLPVGLISIETNSADEKITFQVDEKRLSLMLDVLGALQADLKAAGDFFKGSEMADCYFEEN